MKQRTWPPETGVILVFAALTLWFLSIFPQFRTGANAAVILSSSAEIAIIAAGMTLVIATGGIDISVGSIVGLCAVTLGVLAAHRGVNLWLCAAAALGVGAGCGLINGLLIARFQLPPIIATLATFSAARAGAYVLSHGDSISGLPESLITFGYGAWLGVPSPAWAALAALVLTGALLHRTAFGRSALALGGSREAAFLSGLAIRRTELCVYVFSGLLAGLASILVTARGATAIPDAGRFFEFSAITAVVLGGTPISGGRATVIGTALGVLTLGVVQNGVRSYGKDDIWALCALGVALLAAVQRDRAAR